MAKFTKPIVSAGIYSIPQEDGSTRKEVVDAKRLKHWAREHKRLVKNGNSIPAPLAHSKEQVPVQTGTDGTLPRSDLNAGWWEKLWVESGDDGVPTLFGTVDVDGDVDDPASLAGRIGKSIKETSIYARTMFTDGKQEEYTDAPMHIALVTHPVEPGQETFTPIEDEVALAMSQRSHIISMSLGDRDGEGSVSVGDSKTAPQLAQTGNSINDLVANLQKIAKIALPKDTSSENLVERLNAALLQKSASEQGDEGQGTVRTPPEGAVEQPAPIAMSFSQAQVDALSAADVTNPSTGKAFTADELTAAGTSPAKNEETLMSQLKNHAQVNVALMNHVTDGAKTNYAKRIKGLVEDKTITKDYAEKSLAPLLDGFQMSFGDDGSFKPHALDHALNALEATNAGTKKSALGTVLDLGGQGTMQNSTMDVLNALAMSQNGGLPAGLNLEGGSLPDGNGAISEDDADKIAKSFLENTGHVTVGN